MVTLAEQVARMEAQLGAVAGDVAALRAEMREHTATEQAMFRDLRDTILSLSTRVVANERDISHLEAGQAETKGAVSALRTAFDALKQAATDTKARVSVWGAILIPIVTAALTWALITRWGA